MATPNQLKRYHRLERATDRDESTDPVLTLRTEDDVHALLRRSRVFYPGLRLSKVGLAIQGLPDQVQEIAETQLNAYLKECGCPAGNAAAALGILLYVAMLFAVVGSPSHWRWQHLLIGLPLILALAVIGKLTALLRARLKFIGVLGSLLGFFHEINAH